jgi:hypothetical protein
MDLRPLLGETKGWLQLGHPLEAVETLEKLPPEYRADFSVLLLRIEAWILLERYQEARILLDGIKQAGQGQFDWHLLAARLEARTGAVEAAKEQIILASKANLERRLEIVDCPELAKVIDEV